MPVLTINLEQDLDCENPLDIEYSWKHVSFRRNSSDKIADYFNESDTEWIPKIGLRRKLAVGTAFILDCYDHSGVAWNLQGEGPQCRWDTSHGAGLLLWEHKASDLGAKDYKGREADARSCLKEYNMWANGGCYAYCIESKNEGENDLDSCCGYIGYEYMVHEIESSIVSWAKRHYYGLQHVQLEFKGDCKWIGSHINPLKAA